MVSSEGSEGAAARPAVRRLGAEEAPLVTSVLCEAFHDYPVMRYVLGTAAEDYDHRLERLIGFFVMARVLRREPLLGIEEGPELGAVALVSDPDGPPSPAELAALRREVWADLGAGARARYKATSSASRSLSVGVPHLHLNMIGTRRRARGRGLGRRLLEHVHRMSSQDPKSQGVTLTTEDPKNLPFYDYFGYQLVGHARVSPELETWAFFRPDRPGGET